MKKALLIVIGCFAFTFFIKSYSDNVQTQKREIIAQTERVNIMKFRSAKVKNALRNNGAKYSWLNEFKKNNAKGTSKKTSVERRLRQLWLTRSPHLMLGRIHKVSTLNSDTYYLDIVQKQVFKDSSGGYTLEIPPVYEELHWIVMCNKIIVDRFLEQHPQDKMMLDSGVAVIANIQEVFPIKSGDSEIVVGKGRCVDMIYMGAFNFDGYT